jgi:hypothetical protein
MNLEEKEGLFPVSLQNMASLCRLLTVIRCEVLCQHCWVRESALIAEKDPMILPVQ